MVTSYAERDLTTALATKNQPDFFESILKFVAVIVLAVPLQVRAHPSMHLATRVRVRQVHSRSDASSGSKRFHAHDDPLLTHNFLSPCMRPSLSFPSHLFPM